MFRGLHDCFSFLPLAISLDLFLSLPPSSLLPSAQCPGRPCCPSPAARARSLTRLSSRHAAFLPHCCLASYSSSSSLTLSLSRSRGCSVTVGLFAPPRLHCSRRRVGRSVGRRAPSSVVAIGLAASEVAVLYYSLHPSLPLSRTRRVQLTLLRIGKKGFL